METGTSEFKVSSKRLEKQRTNPVTLGVEKQRTNPVTLGVEKQMTNPVTLGVVA